MGDTNDDTPFNMAMLFYIRINKLMAIKDQAAIMEDIPGWYKCLRSLYRNIFFKIDKKDRENLEELFEKAKRALRTKTNSSTLSAQITSICLSNAAEILDDIDSMMMVLMDKKNMIFPNIKAGGLEELSKRFGLK